MAYFDDLLTGTPPDDEAENRRKVLAAIASSSKPSVLGQPANAQPNQPGTRAYDLSVNATNQPTPPAPRLTPTPAPDINALPKLSGITGPYNLGQPAVRPARPDVMPTRGDFPTKPLPTWEKVLGVAAAPFVPALSANILAGPQRTAERNYQQAFQEYKRPLDIAAERAGTAKIQAEAEEASARAESLRNAPEKPVDETKQPIGDAGAAQHAQQLETLTGSMTPQEKQQFLGAYGASATDTHAVATKRFEDAKGAAQLVGAERDRALQRGIAERNHQDQQANIAENRATRQQQQDAKQVIAFDPKTKERSLMTAGDARQRGLTIASEAKAGDEEKAGEFNAQANDVQMNTSRYRSAMSNVKTPFSKTDVLNATQILSDPQVNNFLLQQAGFPMIMSQITQGDKAKAWNALPPDKQQAVIGYLRMKGSAIAYQKMLTNQGRTSKEGLDIELANIPSPILGATVANKQLDAFQENIDVAAQRAVRLPWMETPKDVRARIEGQTPQGGGAHSFTVNGVQYQGVSDEDYARAKKLKGFKE